MLLGAARRRLAGRALSGASAAVAAFNLLVVCGYILSYSDLVSPPARPPGRLSALMGAVALFYLMLATGVLVLRGDSAVRPQAPGAARRSRPAPSAACGRQCGTGRPRRRAGLRVRTPHRFPSPGNRCAHCRTCRRIWKASASCNSAISISSAFLSENDLARVVDAAVETAPPPGGRHRRPDFLPRRPCGRLHPPTGTRQGRRRSLRLHGQS